MYKTQSLLFFYFSLFSSAFSQAITIEGQVVDSKLKTPLAYTTVGIMGRPIGTNADENGKFKLILYNKAIEDDENIIFSCVGYESKEIKLSDLIKKFNHIELSSKPTLLKEVIVSRKDIKNKVLGKKGKGGLTHFNIYSLKDSIDDGLSKEFGTVINVGRYCLLENFNVYLSSNSFSKIRCRLNFYNIQNGIPDSTLQTKDIIFEIEGYQLGWITLDLKSYNIEIDGLDKIAATIQLIETQFTGRGQPILAVPAAFPSPFNAAVFRDKGHAKWVVNNSANPSIFLNARCSHIVLRSD